VHLSILYRSSIVYHCVNKPFVNHQVCSVSSCLRTRDDPPSSTVHSSRIKFVNLPFTKWSFEPDCRVPRTRGDIAARVVAHRQQTASIIRRVSLEVERDFNSALCQHPRALERLNSPCDSSPCQVRRCQQLLRHLVGGPPTRFNPSSHIPCGNFASESSGFQPASCIERIFSARSLRSVPPTP
jgi:hypothetical protein